MPDWNEIMIRKNCTLTYPPGGCKKYKKKSETSAKQVHSKSTCITEATKLHQMGIPGAKLKPILRRCFLTHAITWVFEWWFLTLTITWVCFDFGQESGITQESEVFLYRGKGEGSSQPRQKIDILCNSIWEFWEFIFCCNHIGEPTKFDA